MAFGPTRKATNPTYQLTVLLVGDISKRWSEVDNKCKPMVNKRKPEPVKRGSKGNRGCRLEN